MYLSKNKKSGIYYCYFRKEDGKKTRASTKCLKKKDALNFLTTFEKELKNRKPSNTITLGEVRKKYLMAIDTTHSKGSYRHSKMCLKNLIEFVGEDVNINEIGKEQVEKFIFGIYKRSKHSASLHLRHLKAIFNKAIDWSYLEKNPFKGIKLRIPTNNPVFITKEELEIIVGKEGNPILASLYRFAFYTGMRSGEILNLEWSNIDMVNKLIQVKNKGEFTTKSKKERIIPIGNIIYDILCKLKQYRNDKHDYIFSNHTYKLNSYYVSKRFENCVRLSSLCNGVHHHTLRHSFASALAQKGVHLFVIQKILGHSNITTTQIYSHLRNEDLVKAINELN
jgi:site-specific recombinase XerD